jgi:hypothetical protein
MKVNTTNLHDKNSVEQAGDRGKITNKENVCVISETRSTKKLNVKITAPQPLTKTENT